MNVSGQTMRHSGIWLNEIVALNPYTVTPCTVDLAILHIQGNLSFTQEQVPDSPVGVLMYPHRLLPAHRTGGRESLIRFQRQPTHFSVLRNTLTHYLDSLIGEIRRYTYVGHLRPPLPKGLFDNPFLAEDSEDVHSLLTKTHQLIWRRTDLLDCEWPENKGLRKLLVPLLNGEKEAIRHSVVKTNMAFMRSPSKKDIDIEAAKREAVPFLLDVIGVVRPRLVILTGVKLTDFLKYFCSKYSDVTPPIRDDKVRHVIFESASARLLNCNSTSLVVRVDHASQFSWTYDRYNVVERIRNALDAQQNGKDFVHVLGKNAKPMLSNRLDKADLSQRPHHSGSWSIRGNNRRRLAMISSNDPYSIGYDFFQQLLKATNKRTNIFENVSPTTVQRWIHAGAGKSGLKWVYGVMKNTSRVAFDVCHPDREVNRSRFAKLISQKNDIERNFGEALSWKSSGPGGHQWLESTCLLGGLDDKEKWLEIQKDLVDRMVRLEGAIGPHIKSLL
jgi:hypothetical protein